MRQDKENVEERLALTKVELHQKTDVFEEMTLENAKLKKRLADEETKREKSISLLRGAKNKIIKMEKEKKENLAEIEKQKKLNEDLKKQVNDKKGDKDKLLFIVETKDKSINELISERDKLKQQVEDKDKTIKDLNIRLQDETSENLIQSLNKNIIEKTEELENYKSKYEVTRKSLTECQKTLQEKEDHIKILVDSITQLQSHNNTLEQELDTSKHLFQVKSDENDKLKFKMSEIQSTMSLLESKKEQEDEERQALANELADLKSDLQKKLKETLQSNTVQQELSTKIQSLEGVVSDKEKELTTSKNTIKELQETIDEIKASEMKAKLLMNEENKLSKTLKEELEDCKKKLNSVDEDKKKEIEDYKIREQHLKAVNKTLKEELKKLQRSPRNSISGESNNGSSLKSPYYASRQQTLPSNPNALKKSQSEANSPAVLHLHPNKSLNHSNTEIFTMDDINVEYLKAVLFKFFEFKDKKIQLLNVLSTILNFTPEETQKMEKLINNS